MKSLDFRSRSEPHVPYWMESIPNLGPEERREQMRPKNYKKLLKKLRVLDRKFRLNLSSIAICPTLLENKLAELAALNPSSNRFKILGIGSILGKGQYEKLRCILLWIEYSFESEWLRFLILEPFQRLIPRNSTNPGIQSELKFLDMILSMEISQRRDLIEKIYSDHNLKSMIERGRNLVKHFEISLLETNPVAISQRKRGYNDKGSTSLRSEKERKRSMNEMNKRIEEIKREILERQLLIYKQNLDRILEVQNSESRHQIKEIVSNLDNDIKDLYEEQLSQENDYKNLE